MLEMFGEQDGGEGLWGWSVLAGEVGNELVELGRAKTQHPEPPYICLKDHLDYHMEYGEILIQVRDDSDLDNGQASGHTERRWDGDTVWWWNGQDLQIGMVGGGEIKIPISAWFHKIPTWATQWMMVITAERAKLRYKWAGREECKVALF